MDDSQVEGQTDLREYLQVLNRRKAVILTTFLLVLGLAIGYSELKKPIYTATASVLIPQEQASAQLNLSNPGNVPQAANLQRTLVDEQKFAEGDDVKAAAAKTLGYQASVSIGASSTADILTFSASSGVPQQAANVANAYANAYISAQRTDQVSQYTQQVTALQTSISQLQAQMATLNPKDPQYIARQNSVNTLTQSVEETVAAAQLATQSNPTVITAAQVPTAPSSPKKTRNGILGGAVGLILGIGLAFLRDRLDDGINSRETAERAANGLPVIALLPLEEKLQRDKSHLALIEDPTSPLAEAYRTLRTAVQFLGIDEPKKVIAVTSSIPGEGKTTTAANLAVSFARAGQRVTVVSCDLRRPRLNEFFGVDPSVGLTSVLLGQADLGDVIRTVEGEPLLRVVASGPVPPNPAEILGSDRTKEVINRLAADSDVVILDSPPVLPVTDALLVARMCEGVLVLASTKTTSVRDLHRTIQMLGQVKAPVLGLVLNRVPSEGGYSAYGYGYGYGYGSSGYESYLSEQSA